MHLVNPVPGVRLAVVLAGVSLSTQHGVSDETSKPLKQKGSSKPFCSRTTRMSRACGDARYPSCLVESLNRPGEESHTGKLLCLHSSCPESQNRLAMPVSQHAKIPRIPGIFGKNTPRRLEVPRLSRFRDHVIGFKTSFTRCNHPSSIIRYLATFGSFVAMLRCPHRVFRKNRNTPEGGRETGPHPAWLIRPPRKVHTPILPCPPQRRTAGPRVLPQEQPTTGTGGPHAASRKL